jgi:hypothetical protein
MIAVALAVIAGVVAVTCGVVADSNHADTLSFLGLMVKTTAAQIFLAGAICTWAPRCGCSRSESAAPGSGDWNFVPCAPCGQISASASTTATRPSVPPPT